METERGLSIIEIIFSVGVTVLVITGVVSLMVQSTGTKTDAFKRERASVVAQKVIEGLIDQKRNNRDVFWNLTPTSGEIENYSYSVGYSGVTTGDCRDSTPWNCVDALVNISWGNSETLVVKRFFSKFY